MTEQRPSRARELEGIAFGAAAAVAFGTLAIFVKFAYREGAEGLPLLAVRFAVAFALLAVFVLIKRRGAGASARKVLTLMALGGIGYAFEASLFFAALDRAPAGVVALIFYSYPLWTAVIALTLRLEPFRWGLIVALALGTGGIVTIFSIPSGDVTGILLALASAVAVAIYLVGAQVFTKGVDSGVSSTWTAAGAAVSLSVVWAIAGGALPSAALPHAAGLGLATALAFAGLYAAVTRIGSSRTAIATMVEPVTTVLLAAVLLDEPITARVFLGMVLIVAALPILATASPQRSEVAADTL